MSGMFDSQRYPLNLFISNIEEDVVNFLQYKSKNHFMRDSTVENNPFSARKLRIYHSRESWVLSKIGDAILKMKSHL